jgi:CBS domain-containing protein
MKVRDAMMPDIETVGSNETIRRVAELMADLGVSALPVSESDHLVGIVTAREIAIRIAAEALDPTRAPVRQAMSSDVLYCFENEDIEDVSQKMAAWWVRRLPVVDREKRLVGMISLAHIAVRTAASNPRETASELHTPIHNRRACLPS